MDKKRHHKKWNDYFQRHEKRGFNLTQIKTYLVNLGYNITHVEDLIYQYQKNKVFNAIQIFIYIFIIFGSFICFFYMKPTITGMLSFTNNSDPLDIGNNFNILFVDKYNSNCDDSNNRNQVLSGNSPWCTLGELDKIQSGDTIYISAGEYNDEFRLEGMTFNENITISAYPGNEVNLTRYNNEGYTLTPNDLWSNESANGLWKTILSSSSTNYPRVYHKNMSKYFTWNNFNNFINSNYTESTWYNSSSKELFLMFSNLNFNPNNIPVFIANEYRPIYIRNNQMQNNAYIIISNLTFQYYINGINIYDQSNIIIKNCNFYGGHNAINVNNIDKLSHSNLIFKDNYIDGKQNYNWWAGDMKEEATEETTGIFVQDHMGSVFIYNNTFNNWHGGITLYTDSSAECNGSEIYNNQFINGRGSQIEIENYCSNSVWHHNLIKDSDMGVSFAPADASNSNQPCEFHHNQIILKSNMRYFPFEIDPSYAIKSEYRNSKSVENWNIHHNTFYANGRGLNAINDDTWKNTTFIDNIFYSKNEYTLFRTGLASDNMYYNYNLYFLDPSGTKLLQRWNNNNVNAGYNTLAQALSSSDWDGTWDINSNDSNPQFNDISSNDFRPIASSPACNMSTTGSYVGALPCIGQIISTFCGDNTCDNNETCDSCQTDCGVCINETFCGDNTCDNNETCNSCQTDCGVCPVESFCGDNTCDNNETCNSCQADCGACPPEPFCGDNTCDNNETCNSCQADCGACPIESFCGDNTCDNNETCDSCQADCGACPPEPFCGDNTCDDVESCSSCATDCGTCKKSSSGGSSSTKTTKIAVSDKSVNFTNKSVNINTKVKQNVYLNLNNNRYKIKLYAINSETVEFIILDDYYEFNVGEEKIFIFNQTNVSIKLKSKNNTHADFKITKQIQEKQIVTQKQPELKVQENNPEEVYKIEKTNKTIFNESPKIIEKNDVKEPSINNFTIAIFLIISISVFSYSLIKSKKSFDWFIKKDDKNLKNWIKLAKKNNYTDKKIIKELTKNGWPKKLIKEMMK
jgi:hypothetical protein